MNAIPSLSLHTNSNSSGNSPKPAREAQASPSLRSRPSEPTPAAPRIGLASVPSLSTLPTPAKRSYEVALGSLPPYSNWLETASQAGRLPGEAPLPKRRRTGDETPVVIDASWSGSEAPLSDRFSALPAPSQGLLRAPQGPSGTMAGAGRLSGLDIIERALSADDQTANLHIQLFLESTLAPGIMFTTFIEGLKILTMHAALRRPSLQNWPPARIFREGISSIGAACTKICGPGQAAADRATMRGQMKAALFAQGTPHNFIMLATAAWRSTKKARRDDQTLATSYYVLKELGVFSKLKAINDASVVESQLSCHERLDAMRMQLAAQGGAHRIDSDSVHRASEARPAMAWTSQALLGLDMPSHQPRIHEPGGKAEDALATVSTVGPAAAGMTAITSTTTTTYPMWPTSAIPFISYPALEQATPATTWPIYRMDSVSSHHASEANPAIGWTSQALLGLDSPS